MKKIVFPIIIISLLLFGFKDSTNIETKKIIMKGEFLNSTFYPYSSSKEEWNRIVSEMVKVVHLEAGGEDVEGWKLVAFSVLNRLHYDGFPTNIVGVINHRNEHRPGAIKCQYDAICMVGSGYIVPKEQHNKIAPVVVRVLMGLVDDPCPDAIYYYNPDKVNEPPHWASPETFVGKVGNHICHTA